MSSPAFNIDAVQTENALLERLLRFAAPQAADDSHPVHRLHPYPAKFIPQLPREVLLDHTNERHTVLDPFCGSGTTLVESALLGRKSIGIDANPIAGMVARAKTTPLTRHEQNAAKELADQVACIDPAGLPSFSDVLLPRQDHWFQPNMQRELAAIRTLVADAPTPALKTLLSCVFSSIVTSASRQDSETRYKAVEKNQPDGYAFGRFIKRLDQALSAIRAYSESDTARRNIPLVITQSTETVGKGKIADRSVDIVITSPPYPNSFDYYLYHKLRMAWLGFDFALAKGEEIGSRYEHSSRRAPVDVFVARMEPVMRNIARMLKPSKLAYFFVGDAVVQGKYINMTELYTDLARRVGLELVGETAYDLAGISKSFRDTRRAAGNGHRHSKLQRILVFERRTLPHEPRPVSRLGARPTPIRDPVPVYLGSGVGEVVALESNERDRHVHGLAPFPSKFIPELPRWAVREFTGPGDTVVDPFGGSGTTAVEALLAGRSAVSIDVNPYACLMTEAKTRRVGLDTATRAARQFLEAAQRPKTLPDAQRLDFELDTFWFEARHLSEFARLHRYVLEKLPEETHPFFRVVLGSLIRHFSYQDVAQIKVKRDPKKVMRGTPSPSALLLKRLPVAVDKWLGFQRLAGSAVEALVECSSADLFAASAAKRGSSFRAMVTSPPYINAMNYPMATRYELVLLGLVPPDRLREHQTRYFGTERVYARDFNHPREVPERWTCAEYLNPRLASVFASEPKRSYIAYSFFERMAATFHELVNLLEEDGVFVLVAGTNTIRGVPINTFEVLTSLLEDAGLKRERVFHYEIIKQVFKITRHETAAVIPTDGVAVLRR